MNNQVGIFRDAAARYSDAPPFHPPEAFPEIGFDDRTDPANGGYRGVRECFRLMGLDSERFGTPEWNPLGQLVRPGDTVLLKPNLIADHQDNSDAWHGLITHGSIIRAVADYVILALKGDGRVILADGCQEDSSIQRIRELIGVAELQTFYKEHCGIELTFLDLRDKYRVRRDGVYVDTVELDGDPRGNTRCNLGSESRLIEVDHLGKVYYGSFYDVEETNLHHTGGVHEYMISRSALEADVFICLPKLKTHKKVGVTLSLKNLVGINGQKNWLPHYALGSPEENGDQFPSRTARRALENKLVLGAKKKMLEQSRFFIALARMTKGLAYRVFGSTDEVVRSGNWSGNDTCWRMTQDLNRILLYASPDGELTENRKRYFTVVDGIIGMQGNGPLSGDEYPVGVVVAGFDPVGVDSATATIMGLDWRRIPLLRRSFDRGLRSVAGIAPESVEIRSNNDEWNGSLEQLGSAPHLGFRPHFGWIGSIEREE
jgi:uncharacterized protein (DUF362 family)